MSSISFYEEVVSHILLIISHIFGIICINPKKKKTLIKELELLQRKKFGLISRFKQTEVRVTKLRN